MKYFYFLFFLPILVFGAKAPDFTITDYKNKVHNLYADYLDKDKVVVIKFFFVDCPPCNTLAPYVQTAYNRWGGGTGRVEFFELSTQNWDNNIDVKGYALKHGLTYPGAGQDGGAFAACAPYKNGTFGPFYGTPSFAVIDPTGEVNYGVRFTTSNQVEFDTAVARALRVTRNTGGGGGTGCAKVFSVNTITTKKPTQIIVQDITNSGPEYVLANGSYNCEFQLPQNTSNYSVYMRCDEKVSIPTQGISTADIVQIQRNILGLNQFTNMQKAVADVNNSGTVSASDIVELRKLILGIIPDFAKVPSYAICNNPKGKNDKVANAIKIDELISKTAIPDYGIWRFGDVTGANFFAAENGSTRATDPVKFLIKTTKLPTGKYLNQLCINSYSEILTMQFSLALGNAEVSNLKANSSLINFSENNFIVDSKNEFRLTWDDPNGVGSKVQPGHLLCSFESDIKISINLGKRVVPEITSRVGTISSIVLTQAYYDQNKISIINDQKSLLIRTEDEIGEFKHTVFNLQGAPITSTLENNINISHLYKGIYFLESIDSKGQKQISKFLKS